MHLLFLCSQNKRRSLTAEKLLDGYDYGEEVSSYAAPGFGKYRILLQNWQGIEGLNAAGEGDGLIGWADMIFCMEKKHLRRIREKYSDIIADKTVICLNIPDEYSYMDDDLCELLECVVPEYL